MTVSFPTPKIIEYSYVIDNLGQSIGTDPAASLIDSAWACFPERSQEQDCERVQRGRRRRERQRDRKRESAPRIRDRAPSALGTFEEDSVVRQRAYLIEAVLKKGLDTWIVCTWAAQHASSHPRATSRPSGGWCSHALVVMSFRELRSECRVPISVGMLDYSVVMCSCWRHFAVWDLFFNEKL